MTTFGALAHGSKRKLQGLAFLLVVALLLALTIAIYDKTFQSTIPVTLYAQRAGEQLDLPADVMVRGIDVGQVRAEQVTRGYAKLDIALYPAEVHLIPANVTAEILPETLFGEKYVDLVLPAHPAAPIRANAVIGLNRSTTALETDQLFNNLLPLLRALHPAQLSETLSALANALSGRGAELGANLVGADTYFKGFNPHLGVFEADIAGLANVAGDYSAAAQNILTLARNFSFNARTLVEKQDTFAQFLAGTSGFANTMTAVLQQNETNLILLPTASLPTLQVLARYAPEYTCLVDGLVKLSPLLHAAFGALPGSHSELHITLLVNQKQGAPYTYPTDLPKYGLNSGPNCDGLPSAPPAPGYAPPQPSSLLHTDAAIGLAGSPTENAAVAALAAPILGVPSQDVPSFADLLLGPVLRGEVVSYS
jgi:phospholipid/cholesterol/gamma-HCH transport system substrate-binding protein